MNETPLPPSGAEPPAPSLGRWAGETALSSGTLHPAKDPGGFALVSIDATGAMVLLVGQVVVLLALAFLGKVALSLAERIVWWLDRLVVAVVRGLGVALAFGFRRIRAAKPSDARSAAE